MLARSGAALALLATVRLRDIEYFGHKAIELVAGKARMVVVHDVGPRIAAYGITGEQSLLFWDERGEHRRGDWRLYGGHRFWLTRPGADESEETYAPDNEPCRVIRGRAGLSVIAPLTPSRIEKTLSIRVRDGAWLIEHRLRNRGDMLWSGGAWGLTCTRPARATRYFVPLGMPSGGWDLVSTITPRRWGGTHTSRLADPQFVMREDALEIRPRGTEGKRFIRAPLGALVMSDERATFRKHARFDEHASYPLAMNIAAYVGERRFMVELETMSPLVTLAPDQAFAHVETWSLVRGLQP